MKYFGLASPSSPSARLRIVDCGLRIVDFGMIEIQLFKNPQSKIRNPKSAILAGLNPFPQVNSTAYGPDVKFESASVQRIIHIITADLFHVLLRI